MATDALEVPDSAAVPASPVAGAHVRSGRESWVDWLLRWLEELPGPRWLAYVGLGTAGVLLAAVGAIASSVTEPWEFAALVFWGAFIPLTLWLVDYLGRVAGSAFDDFRPILSATDEEAAHLRHRLTAIPARPALAILLFSAVSTPVYWVVDPEAAAVVGMAPVALVLRFVSETFFGGLIVVFLYQSIRQMRAVDRIHAGAGQIDLFRPAPLFAFSVLTSRTAIVLALVFIVSTAVAASQASGTSAELVFVGYSLVGIVAAALVFVLPLLGMQRRIAAEKRRLQGEVGYRIELTMDAVHAAVDGGDLAGAGAMNGTLGVLVTERDLVDKLPTLPWRAGTLGALITAIVVPLVLSIASRLLERVL